MAKKNGNGHKGNGAEPVVTAIHELTDVVRELQAGQKGIEQILRGHGRQLEALHAGQAETNARLDQTNARLDRLGDRFDNLLERASERDRRLEDDVRGLGERLARLEGREPR
ncbi:MAG: hypothetical protein ACYDCL_21185 [Myxococcales bacterium]